MICRNVFPRLCRQKVNSLVQQFSQNHFKSTDIQKKWSAENYANRVVAELFKREKFISKSRWKDLRDDCMKNCPRINDRNIDSLIIRVCAQQCYALQNALLYVEYINESNISLNTSTSLGLLDIYWKHRNELNSTDIGHAEKLCCDVREKTKDHLMANMLTGLLRGLSITKLWKEGVKLIYHSMKKSEHIHNIHYGASAIIERAFKEGEINLGLLMLEKIAGIPNLAMIPPEVFRSYWKYCEKNIDDLEKHVTVMLELIEAKHIFLSKQTVQELGELLRLKNKILQDATIDEDGICNKCKNTLQKVTLKPEEYEILQKELHNKVIFRNNNVYLTSNPEEVKRFKDSLKTKYDWIIDGLNLGHKYIVDAQKDHDAYTFTATVKQQSKMVAATIDQLRQNKQNVFLLGRSHMQRWPDWQWIKKNCRYFLVNNISVDDPFGLYAAVCSGPKAYFFSSDKMRNHLHLLGVKCQPIFQKWQQQHQCTLECVNDREKIFKFKPFISNHVIFTHKHCNTWHIPYVDDYTPTVDLEYMYALEKKWACWKL